MKTIKLVGVSLVLAATGCATDEITQDDPSTAEQNTALTDGTPQGPHCVSETFEQLPGEPPPAKPKVAVTRCFDTFASAIFAATNGRVQLAPSITPSMVDDALLNGGGIEGSLEPRAGQIVVAVDYDAANFGGRSHIATGTKTCLEVTHTQLMPASFNDVISSTQVFANCNHSIHFENSFSGAQRDCGRGCTYIGDAMNDRTSSIRWTL